MTQRNWRRRVWTWPWLGLLALDCVNGGEIDEPTSSDSGSTVSAGGASDYLNCNCNRSLDGSFVCLCGTATITYRPSESTPTSGGTATNSVGVNQGIGGSIASSGLSSNSTSSPANAASAGGIRNGSGSQASTVNATNPTGPSATTTQPSGIGGNAQGGAPATGGTRSTVCTDTPRPSESCANAVAWGFCGQEWYAGNCDASCGVCKMAMGGASTGGNRGIGGTSNGPGMGGSQANSTTSATHATGGSSNTSASTTSGGTSNNSGGSSPQSTPTGGNRNTGGTSNVALGGSAPAGGTSTTSGGSSSNSSGGSRSESTVGGSSRVNSAGTNG